MGLRSLHLTAIDHSLKLARLPIDVGLRATGASGSSASSAVDRVEAEIRRAAVAILDRPVPNPQFRQSAAELLERTQAREGDGGDVLL